MILLLISVSCIKLAASIELVPGRPVPHAEELHRMLTAYILNYTDTPAGSLLGYLFNTTGPNNNTYNTENLDINVLDAANIKKIVVMAREQYERQNENEFRRMKESLRHNPYVIELSMKLMQQSIYATKYRIQDTRPYRKRFRDSESYNIAILVGSLNQIVLRMEHLYTMMMKLPVRTQFLWYLFIYEKFIAGHVDVTYMVKKIFELHGDHLKKLSED